MADDEELLLTSDVAKKAGVSAEAVRLWAVKGLIPHKRVNRNWLAFRVEDVEEFLAERDRARRGF